MLYAILRSATLWHATPCHTLCYPMPCHAMPCHAMPCHATPFHATLWYAMTCHALRDDSLRAAPRCGRTSSLARSLHMIRTRVPCRRARGARRSTGWDGPPRRERPRASPGASDAPGSSRNLLLQRRQAGWVRWVNGQRQLAAATDDLHSRIVLAPGRACVVFFWSYGVQDGI